MVHVFFWLLKVFSNLWSENRYLKFLILVSKIMMSAKKETHILNMALISVQIYVQEMYAN